MVDHSFDDAVSAFTRINTLGVRFKKEDIENARWRLGIQDSWQTRLRHS